MMKNQSNTFFKNRFVVNDIQYLFVGYRLMFLKSSNDGVEIWQDVPEHFGRFYPCAIELPARKVSLMGEGVWFSKQLEEILNNESIEYKIESKLPAEDSTNVIIVNCLDPIFGHALYKLSAAAALSKQFPDSHIIVLLTSNMLPYATFSDYYIAINEGPSKLFFLSHNLNAYFQKMLTSFNSCTLAFCNTSRVNGQQELPGAVTFPPGKPEYLTFIHRNDRYWGMSLAMQIKRVNKVFATIKKMNPDVKTAVIGIEQKKLKYRADLSLLHKKPCADFESDLAHLAHNSLCVFGVHGSNMLVPSYYAQNTLELLPYNRLDNFSQAYWPNPTKTAIEVVFSFRVLYGDRFLLNLSSKKVTRIVDHLIKRAAQLKLRLDDAVLQDPNL